MGKIDVTAPKVNRTVSIEKNFGATTEDKVNLFTEDVCNSCLDAIFTIKCQAVVRAKLVAVNEAGERVFTDEQAIAAGEAYVPQKATRAEKKSATTILAEKVVKGELSEKDLVREIRAQIALLEKA